MRRRRFLPAAFGLAVMAVSVPLSFALARDPLAPVRQATERFHDVSAAGPAGYGLFYRCTDNEGLNAAMGQHFADVPKVLDPAINALDPEVLVYEPKPGGGYRLVAVEYVVFQESWTRSIRTRRSCSGERLRRCPRGTATGCPTSTSSTPGSGRATREGPSTTGTQQSRAGVTATRHNRRSASLRSAAPQPTLGRRSLSRPPGRGGSGDRAATQRRAATAVPCRS
jgi:hypothetical protein